MATFQAQVEGLTSLSIGVTPTTAEFTQFLRDGVIDVTRRTLAVKPNLMDQFGRETSSDSQGVDIGGARIISVMREANADGSSDGSSAWYPCRQVPMSMQSQVVDPESLNFASIYNPVYTINSDNTINVYPTPSSNNGMKIFYVNEEPRDITNNTNLAYNHENIKYFPTDKVNLVVIYAALKTLQAVMGSKSIDTLSITAVPPDTPSAPNFSGATVSLQTAGSLGTPPTYTAPTVGSATEELTASMDADSAGYGTDADFLNFSKWFSVAGKLIEDEEDSEMAAAQLQKIGVYINSYQAALQNQTNIFTKENTIYQSTVQEAMQELQVAAAKAQKDADLAQQKEISEYSSRLQRFQNEIASYQADVANQVQEYGAYIQEVTAEYQWLQGQYASLKKDYDDTFMLMAGPRPAAKG